MDSGAGSGRAPAVIPDHELRRILGQFATGVAVITATVEGAHHGLTVNSFSSLSLSPPQIIVCLKRQNRSFAAFERASHFCVNVLAEGQIDLARLFAGVSVDKFTGLAHRPGAHSGAPLLGSAHAWLECEVTGWLRPRGSHDVVVGTLIGYALGEDRPLLFHGGRYHRLGDPIA